ncbi:MAG: 4-(cytidine 5'-diphospho)-2-C-methyl-D-erythritol kinase [Candidatus Methylacidiphilales bacterium]|nr:4-(cytidine 5'-diphospho)-2-C-methyl-D-erythritol kinase [Candidatus Methylacidiphilales bacterium]
MQLFAPAKLNLYLHILGRRADGFHELETLMVPLKLGDIITLEERSEPGVGFTCTDDSLPTDVTNLAVKAAIQMLERYAPDRGVSIHLEKRLPHGAGLGGGSSDAATVLGGVRELLGLDVPDDEILDLAATLGSDVPFFLYRSAAICRGRGEIVEPVQLQGRYRGVLIHPGFAVPTPWAYKKYAETPTPGKSGATLPDGVLRNDLEPPVFRKYLWLPAAKDWLRSQPEVLDALMSGSGSCVFALLKDGEDPASLMERCSEELGPNCWVAEFEDFITPAPEAE